jgi:RNA-directed DNA polymerase
LNENNNNSSLARIISSLCTVSVIHEKNETDNNETKRIEVLPQGAPTSPIISNLICEKLDYKLDKLARNAGVNYSRYADDITFSCQHSLFNSKGKFTKEIESIITKEGFSINPSKTRLQKRGWTQQVTGLVVNEKVNVPKIYVKEIRKWLYLLESYDYDKATNYFNNDYRKNKGNALRKLPKIETVLEGKLLYLIMIKGANDSSTKNLMLRFKKIKDTKLKLQNKEMLFDEVLSQLLNGNLTVAMQTYLKGKIGK